MRASSKPDSVDWTFDRTWPWEPRWFDTDDGRLHYVDEGPRDGSPVVLVHGNPTWGYLWRNFIPALVEAGHRVIVPDHLGFGRSDKPGRSKVYDVRRHAERFEALLESLDLRRATLVALDWGGPIGLYWATRHPDRVAGLFLLNTFAFRPPDRVEMPLPLRVFRMPGLGEVAVKGLDLFKRGLLLRAGIVRRERITKIVRRAYLAPHPSWSSRTAILAFPRQIPTGPSGRTADFLGEVEAGLGHFTSKPATIVWPERNMLFGEIVLTDGWLRVFPHAELLRLPEAGQFPPEDAHEEIVPELLKFLARSET